MPDRFRRARRSRGNAAKAVAIRAFMISTRMPGNAIRETWQNGNVAKRKRTTICLEVIQFEPIRLPLRRNSRRGKKSYRHYGDAPKQGMGNFCVFDKPLKTHIMHLCCNAQSPIGLRERGHSIAVFRLRSE